MTLMRTQIGGGERPRARAGARRALVLAWSVSRPEAAARGLGSRGGAGPVRLEVQVDLAGPDAAARIVGIAARLLDGGRVTEVECEDAGAACTCDGESGMLHIDIPGVVRLSMLGERVVYARTDLLRRLGVEGGRYERAGASLR